MLQTHEMFAGSKRYQFLSLLGNVYCMEELGVDWRVILKLIFEKEDTDAQTTLICPSIGTEGRIF
jgi:hypothetical protein